MKVSEIEYNDTTKNYSLKIETDNLITIKFLKKYLES